MKEVSKFEDAEEILEIPNSYVERGKAIGREEGREEGRTEGRAEGQEAVALEMLKEGFSIEKVMKLTKVTKERMAQLKEKL